MGEGWGCSKLSKEAETPLNPLQIIDISSVCSQPDLGWVLLTSTLSVVMTFLVRLRCLLSSGIMRCSASRTTTQRQWCQKASFDH